MLKNFQVGLTAIVDHLQNGIGGAFHLFGTATRCGDRLADVLQHCDSILALHPGIGQCLSRLQVGGVLDGGLNSRIPQLLHHGLGLLSRPIQSGQSRFCRLTANSGLEPADDRGTSGHADTSNSDLHCLAESVLGKRAHALTQRLSRLRRLLVQITSELRGITPDENIGLTDHISHRNAHPRSSSVSRPMCQSDERRMRDPGYSQILMPL